MDELTALLSDSFIRKIAVVFWQKITVITQGVLKMNASFAVQNFSDYEMLAWSFRDL